MRWSDYSTGERIKILRGGMTQEGLAAAAGVSVSAVGKAEQDQRAGMAVLLKLCAALDTDIAVVLGQQEPRRALSRDDRAMLRDLSRAVHDTVAGIGLDDEPPPPDEVVSGLAAAWDRYREGRFAVAGAMTATSVREAALSRRNAAEGAEGEAETVLADAFRLAGYVGNQYGNHDLAFAAIGHAQSCARRAGDPLREAMVASGRSWIYLRDARLDQAAELARRSYETIEPGYGANDPYLLATYGWHVVFAAVVAARQGHTAQADDLLSQGRAVAARLGRDVNVNGTAFGPSAVAAQAVGIQVSTGRPGKALQERARMGSLSPLTIAARNRLHLDVALAQAETGRWDESMTTLLDLCTSHPEWARQQALTDVLARRLHRGDRGAARYRRLATILGTSPPRN